MKMRSRAAGIFLAAHAIALAACGLKGPLYLPEERAAAERAAQEAQQKKERATDSAPAHDSETQTPPGTIERPSDPRLRPEH